MTHQMIVATHGQFGKYLIESAAMIVGSMEHVEFVGLEESMTPEELMALITEHLENFTGKTLILADFFGGTPFNTSAYTMKRYDVEIITGVNLPILIELYQAFVVEKRTDLDEVVAMARESIRHIKEI